MSGRRPALGPVVWVGMGEDDRASSRLRVHQWGPRLAAEGIDVTILTYHDCGGGQGEGWLRRRSPRLSAAWAAGKLWQSIKNTATPGGWVIFQEVLPPASLLTALDKRGVRIGFDFSDPVHLANGPEHRFHHRLVHGLSTLPRFRAMVKMAEWSLIENDLLEDLVRQLGGAPVLMRGPVDTEAFRPGDHTGRARPLIGWAGSNGTLPLMRPILAVLSDLAGDGVEFDLQLFGVSGSVDVPGVDTKVTAWSLDAEPDVVRGFDIGLNHMPMTDWTRFRGGAKLVFYMACGVPTVSSPSGIGDQVVQDGVTGFVASDRDEWATALRRLVEDGALRLSMGAAARTEAVSKYSYRAYLPLVLDLLT